MMKGCVLCLTAIQAARRLYAALCSLTHYIFNTALTCVRILFLCWPKSHLCVISAKEHISFLSVQKATSCFNPYFKPSETYKCVRTWECTCIHLPHKPGVRAFIQLTRQPFLTCKRAKLFSLQNKKTDHLSSVIPLYNKVAAKENYIKILYIPVSSPNYNFVGKCWIARLSV